MKKMLPFRCNIKTAILYLALFIPFLSSSQFTVLHSFNDTTGRQPLGSLTLSGKTLYGTALNSFGTDSGCVFSIDTDGNRFRDLFNFNGRNGAFPWGSLLFSGNKLYGMTYMGGANNLGCIFSIDTDGSGYIDLHDFDDNSAALPYGSLIILGNELFGMTHASYVWNYRDGAIFSIHTDGTSFKVLYYFNYLNNNDLSDPQGDLTLSGRTLFGMTFYNGSIGSFGGIFSIDTSGSGYRVLFKFNDTNGKNPTGSLTLAGKVLYGMTGYGGTYHTGVIFSIDTDGSRFKDLFYFKGDSNGGGPSGNLTLSGGRLYGMTTNGGGYEDGLIFSIDTNGGNYKRMFLFNGPNGSTPFGSLTMVNSSLFGVTELGGSYYNLMNEGFGVIFSADTSLNDTSHIMTGSSQLSVVSGQVEVYPNPTSGVATIVVSSKSSIVSQIKLEVFNIYGQQVYSQYSIPNTQYQIDLNNQPTGVYFYRVTEIASQSLLMNRICLVGV